MFHAPTEHAFVNDQLADLEMQIVHKSKTSEKKAIVSIIYTSFADKLHVKGLGTLSPTQKTIEGLDMSETVYLAGQEFYNYQGSFTLPSCEENVNWIVMTKPLDIRSDHIKFFRDKWESNQEFARGRGNNRKIQDINGRRILFGNLNRFDYNKAKETYEAQPHNERETVDPNTVTGSSTPSRSSPTDSRWVQS